VVSAPSLNTFKGRLASTGDTIGIRASLTASEQPTGHSGLTSKAEEEQDFKVHYLCTVPIAFSTRLAKL